MKKKKKRRKKKKKEALNDVVKEVLCNIGMLYSMPSSKKILIFSSSSDPIKGSEVAREASFFLLIKDLSSLFITLLSTGAKSCLVHFHIRISLTKKLGATTP